MRIAYIAPYQGPGLLRRRPIRLNLALAGNLKIELVAELLTRRGHEVEILSQGEVVENRTRFYAAFSEPPRATGSHEVHYASALPVRFVNGWWSCRRTLALFRRRHKLRPFDLVIIYNLKPPQVECARRALNRFNLPVVVEYEDDAFVDIDGRDEKGPITRQRLRRAQDVLDRAAGCIGASPFLLSRFRSGIPSFLLRGVVSDDVMQASAQPVEARKNRVAFSGTLIRSRKGLEPLIKAWRLARLGDWELHIAGDGELAGKLREMSSGDDSIVFHGMLDRAQNARLLGTALIGINPHDVSATPGNVFAFKIIEYLAAGAHVVTTPMGDLEAELENGITYIQDNSVETIALALKKVIHERIYERTAARAAGDTYGPVAVELALDRLVREVLQQSRDPGSDRSNGRAVDSHRAARAAAAMPSWSVEES